MIVLQLKGRTSWVKPLVRLVSEVRHVTPSKNTFYDVLVNVQCPVHGDYSFQDVFRVQNI